jgi:hypothetical protein
MLREDCQAAWAWLQFHAALIDDAAIGNAGPAFGREPSRASKNVYDDPTRRTTLVRRFSAQALKAPGGLEHLSAQLSGEGGEGRS